MAPGFDTWCNLALFHSHTRTEPHPSRALTSYSTVPPRLGFPLQKGRLSKDVVGFAEGQ